MLSQMAGCPSFSWLNNIPLYINKMKRQPTEWEKILQTVCWIRGYTYKYTYIYIERESHISKISEELTQLNNKKE